MRDSELKPESKLVCDAMRNMSELRSLPDCQNRHTCPIQQASSQNQTFSQIFFWCSAPPAIAPTFEPEVEARSRLGSQLRFWAPRRGAHMWGSAPPPEAPRLEPEQENELPNPNPDAPQGGAAWAWICRFMFVQGLHSE